MSKKPKDLMPETESLVKGVGKGLLEEGKTTFKWGFWGALVGAVGAGGFGWYRFGFKAGLIGAGVGAVVGGIGAVGIYLSASLFSD